MSYSELAHHEGPVHWGDMWPTNPPSPPPGKDMLNRVPPRDPKEEEEQNHTEPTLLQGDQHFLEHLREDASETSLRILWPPCLCW